MPPLRRAAPPPAAPPPHRTAPRSAPAANSGRISFDYEPVDADTMTRHANQSVGNYDGYTDSRFQVFRPHDGDNHVRILPRTFDYKALKVDNHWAFPIFVHYWIGPDKATYLCGAEMKGESCCLCEERASIVADDPDEAKALKAGKRYLAWIIDRSAVSEGPKLWAMPASVEKDISIRSRNSKTGAVVQISDPNNGYDISFRTEGKDQQRKYPGLDIERDPSPLSDDVDLANRWLAYIKENPLDKTLNWYEDDYVRQVRSGQAPNAEPEQDEDQPAAPATRAGGRIRAEPEPEPTEELPANGEIDPDDDAGLLEQDEQPPTADEVAEMDEDGLQATIQKWNLDIDMSQFESTEDVAAAINQQLDEQYGGDPNAEVEPEPEPPPPPRRAPLRQAAAPVRRATPPARTGGRVASAAATPAQQRLAGLAGRRAGK